MTFNPLTWHHSDESLKSWAELHPPETPRLLVSIRDVMEIRASKRDSKLPINAGRTILTALPDLLYVIAYRIHCLDKWRPPTSAALRNQIRELRKSRAKILEAEAALEAAWISNPVNLSSDAAQTAGVARGALRQVRHHYEHLLKRTRKQSIRTKKTAGHVRRAVLTTLAEWWYTQDWMPTPNEDDRFLSVAKIIEKHFSGQEPRQLNPRTVTDYIGQGKDLYDEGRRSS